MQHSQPELTPTQLSDGRSLSKFDRIGQQLGNYRLVRLLAEGGFAEVYLGEHIHLGRLAAIKILHAKLVSEDLEQFSEEYC